MDRTAVAAAVFFFAAAAVECSTGVISSIVVEGVDSQSMSLGLPSNSIGAVFSAAAVVAVFAVVGISIAGHIVANNADVVVVAAAV